MLHTVRIGITGVLSDGPTILTGQVSEQPEHEPPGPAAGLHPGKPPGHPFVQPVGLSLPTSRLYSVAHGHRLII
jgi:hypothetical protein